MIGPKICLLLVLGSTEMARGVGAVRLPGEQVFSLKLPTASATVLYLLLLLAASLLFPKESQAAAEPTAPNGGASPQSAVSGQYEFKKLPHEKAEENPPGGPFIILEGHASLLSDIADWSNVAVTFGYAIKGGYRWSESWGVFLQFEQNLWLATEYKKEVVNGAYNIGVGAEYIYADGFCRTSFAMGPSVLAFDTSLDEAGETGMFIDFRPVGLRWEPLKPENKQLTIGLDPLSFAVVMPVLDGIPLVRIEYRSTLYVEWKF